MPVRDYGLLESAVARPLLHSVVRNYALLDGNKRLGLAATIAFLGMNGRPLTLSHTEAYDLVIAVSTAQPDTLR